MLCKFLAIEIWPTSKSGFFEVQLSVSQLFLQFSIGISKLFNHYFNFNHKKNAQLLIGRFCYFYDIL